MDGSFYLTLLEPLVRSSVIAYAMLYLVVCAHLPFSILHSIAFKRNSLKFTIFLFNFFPVKPKMSKVVIHFFLPSYNIKYHIGSRRQ